MLLHSVKTWDYKSNDMTNETGKSLTPEEQALLEQYNKSKPALSWEQKNKTKRVVKKKRKNTFKKLLTKPETYIVLLALVPFGLAALAFTLSGAFHMMVDDELVALVEDPVLSSSYEELSGESLQWTESLVWASNNPFIISVGFFAFFFALAGLSLVFVNIVRAAKKEVKEKR